MTDEGPSAQVSAELLWSLIERRADADPTFRRLLIAHVLFQLQSTTTAGRLLDMLGLPRDQRFPPEVNPLSMLHQVGTGVIDNLEADSRAEEFASVVTEMKKVLDVIPLLSDPAFLARFSDLVTDPAATAATTRPQPPPPDPTPDPDA